MSTIPQALIDMTTKIWPVVFGQETIEELAQTYYDELKAVHAAGGWVHVPNSILAPTRHEQRHNCETLARHGFLYQRPAVGGFEYSPTPNGVRLLEPPDDHITDILTAIEQIRALAQQRAAEDITARKIWNICKAVSA